MASGFYATDDDPIMARRRRLADAMYQQGTQTTPVRNAFEGFSRLAQALVGGYEIKKADDEYRTNQEKDIGAWEGFSKSLTGGADLPTAMESLKGGTASTRAKGAQIGVDYSLKQRSKRDDAALKQTEANVKFARDAFMQNKAPIWDAEGNFVDFRPLQGGIGAAAAEKEAVAAAQAKVDLKYKPQIAAASAAAENPALIAREGGQAQARLPAQQALATHNAQLDIDKSGPVAEAQSKARLPAEMQKILYSAQTQAMQPRTFVPGGTLGAMSAPPNFPQPPTQGVGRANESQQPSGGPEGMTPQQPAFKTIAQAPREMPAKFIENAQKSVASLGKLDATLLALEKNPQAVGAMKGGINALPGGDVINNWFDAKGAMTRAGVADIGSLVLLERSGAAVTAAEYPRAKPFIPKVGDNAAITKAKLERLRNLVREELTIFQKDFSSDAYRQLPSVNAAMQGVQDTRVTAEQANPAASRPRARNPQTGQTIEWDGKAWVPVQ